MPESAPGFSMHSWGSKAQGWSAMHEGAAGRVWKPRRTAVEAIQKCIAWTGGLFIPAMEVRDVTTGAVVWRGNTYTVDGALVYAAAGPAIESEEGALALAAARAEWNAEQRILAAARAADAGRFEEEDDLVPAQGSLF